MAANQLPTPNRYITENDADGASFFCPSIPAPLEVKSTHAGGLQRLAYQTPPPPASLSTNRDLERYKAALQAPVPLITPGGGASVWYNDIPPGAGSPMHRNVSLDVVVVLAGAVELTLSSGETRTVEAGDVVVQRATLHRWRNPSATAWARMVAVVAECRPWVTEKGEVLGAVLLA